MAEGYRVAVLSGKGGTGKTMVSVNLAAVAAERAPHSAVTYVDCDVEEPNGHLFWKPQVTHTRPVSVLVPGADPSLCNGCRVCVSFCRYNALAYISGKVKVFEDVCHSCGGCALLCPQKAMKENPREIGTIQTGAAAGVSVLTGTMNTGEASGVPIIAALLEEMHTRPGERTFIDCPPGSACVVMESIKDADYCILVAEPTLFGAHNLEMVYRLVQIFHKPFGVILNKCQPGANPSQAFCAANGLPVIGEIPFDSELGRLNSDGHIAVRRDARLRGLFAGLLAMVEQEVAP